MDLLFPPVRAGCCVALQLIACRRFMSDDTFAIFAIFVFRVGLAVAPPAVAAFLAAVASAIVPSPCGEGGEEFGDLGGLPLGLRRESGDEYVVAACGGGGCGDEFGGWRG